MQQSRKESRKQCLVNLKKIREAEIQKIPYMLVVGRKEVEDNTVSVRERSSQMQETKTVADFQQNLSY